MVECFYSAVLDECPGIGNHSTCSAADMRIDLKYFLYGIWDDKGGIESSFDCQDDALLTLDADC